MPTIKRSSLMRILPLAVLIALPTFAHAQMQIQPGQWQFHESVTSVDMPGAPPQLVEEIKKPRTRHQCITPAEAALGPLEIMRAKDQCKITRQSVVGGKVDAVLVCDAADGGVMSAVITGTVTPTKVVFNAAIEATGAQAYKMTGTQSGERIGDCP
jgi:hypothetical protein